MVPLDAAKARSLVVGWLARREHSGAEVAAKLARKGCEAGIVQQVVGSLTAQGLLSDERFAEALVRSRTRRGYGPVRIRKELQAKGLPEEAVARWVDPRSPEWLAQLERVRRRKFGAGAPRSAAERARQARFLEQRGFIYEQIREALNSDAAE